MEPESGRRASLLTWSPKYYPATAISGWTRCRLRFLLVVSQRVRDAMVKRILVCSALFAAAMFLSACSSVSLVRPTNSPWPQSRPSPATLQPGDKIRVDVFGEDKLGGEYQLDQAGQVLSASGGHRQSAGHDTGSTRASAGQEISHRISEESQSHCYDRDPRTLLHNWRSAKAGPI